MKKFLLEIVVSLAILASVFGIINSVDWLRVFHLQPDSVSNYVHDQVRDVMSELISASDNTDLTTPVDTLVATICTANGIDPHRINVYVSEDNEVNAFATLGNVLVVKTGLMEECKTPEELAGVISHELAHIQLNHAEYAMTLNLSLAVLLTGITGDPTTIVSLVQTLLSNAFSRSQESAADVQGVLYLQKAHVDAMPLADFLERLSQQNKLGLNLAWFSTHPEDTQRVKDIRKLAKAHAKTSQPYKKLLHPQTWERMKQVLNQ